MLCGADRLRSILLKKAVVRHLSLRLHFLSISGTHQTTAACNAAVTCPTSRDFVPARKVATTPHRSYRENGSGAQSKNSYFHSIEMRFALIFTPFQRFNFFHAIFDLHGCRGPASKRTQSSF